MKLIFILSMTFGSYMANTFNLINNCSYTLWPAYLGGYDGNTRNGFRISEGEGFQLISGQNKTVQVHEKWSGRFWARTNCQSNGHCETGDCGKGINCDGNMGIGPYTIAEFLLGSNEDQDFYSVSLIDGFNVPISIYPVSGTHKPRVGNDSLYGCNKVICNKDINKVCPQELQMKSKTTGQVIQCLNQCARYYGDPKYCCPTVEICQSGNWNKTLDLMFKKECPDVYTYLGDEAGDKFTCVGTPLTSYDIVFCG